MTSMICVINLISKISKIYIYNWQAERLGVYPLSASHAIPKGSCSERG
jgi:hypothetical protein